MIRTDPSTNLETMLPPTVDVVPGATSSYSREDDAIDLKWLIEALYAGRMVMVGAVVLAIALAAAYLFVATPRYEATSQLLIESQKQRIISGDEVAPGLDTGRYMIGQVIDSQIELVRSPRLAERVIRELNLTEFAPRDDDGGMFSRWFRFLRGNDGGAESEAEANERANDADAGRSRLAMTASGGANGAENSIAVNDDPEAVPPTVTGINPAIERGISQNEINAFLAGLDVRRVGLSLIIQVRYFHKDPKQAARIANAVARLYLAEQEEGRADKTERAREWLKVRVGELQDKIARGRQAIEQYKSENDLIDTGGQLLQERELSETIHQAIAAQANSAALLAEVRKLEQTDDVSSRLEATGLALNSDVISDYKRQYSQIQRRLATTISRFGRSYPQVQTIRAEIENLEQEINREMDRLVANLRNQYEVAESKAKLLNDRVSHLKTNLSKSRRLKIELAEMERSAKVDGDLYDSLLSRLRQTELQQSLKQSDTTIVQHAKAPERPTRPRKALVLLGSVLAALALSGVYTLLNEFFGNYLRTTESVRRYLGVHNVISLPYVKRRGKNGSVARRALQDNRSGYVQQVFVLKELLKAFRPQFGGHVIAVVSPSQGDGKTATATSYAQYLASTGENTLLVDCDMHDAGSTALLNPNAAHFIHEIAQDPPVALEDLVTPIGDNLSICAASQTTEGVRPMDVLAGAELHDFIRQARQAFDVIVLDTPGLLDFVDARALAGEVDTLLLVVVADKAGAGMVNAALDPIDAYRGKVHAVVLNKHRAMRG